MRNLTKTVIYTLCLSIVALLLPSNIHAESVVISENGKFQATFPDVAPDGYFTSETNKFIDEHGMFPGDSFTKTGIKVKNLTSNTEEVYLYLKELSTTGDLDEVLLLTINKSSNGAVLINNTPLSDIYVTATEIENGAQGEFLTLLSGNQEVKLDLTITFDPNAGNSYQNKETKFDFILGFTDEIIPEPEPEPTPKDPSPTQPTVSYTITEEPQEQEEEAEEEIEEEPTEIEDTGDVRGLQDCENAYKVEGYVFIDRNNNDKYDENEKVFKDVKVTIYYLDEDGERVDIKTVETDKDGYWNVKLCPGSYRAELHEDDIPFLIRLNDDNPKKFTVKHSDGTKVNFELRSQSWWLCIACFLVVILIVVIFMVVAYFRNKREKEG